MYDSGGFENPAEFADSLDRGLDGVENSIGFDPIIGYTAIPIYNEGLRIEPVTVFGVARGTVDLLRVGRGLGQAIYCEDLDGWERAIRSAEDITRASTLFAILAAPAAGKGGGGSQSVKPQARFLVAKDGTTYDLKPTLGRIESGGTFPHRNDGSIFRNREGNLPSRPDGFYREYVHPSPGAAGPGKMRIVVGLNGEMWFTTDHYSTFTRIR